MWSPDLKRNGVEDLEQDCRGRFGGPRALTRTGNTIALMGFGFARRQRFCCVTLIAPYGLMTGISRWFTAKLNHDFIDVVACCW
jgi:hypothetical protein